MNEEIKLALEGYLRGLLEVLNEDAEIQWKKQTEREVFINLQGAYILEGASPKVLKALGYLAEITLKHRTGKGLKVHLDINGQQERRLEELRQRAYRLAEEAVREAKRIELEPMETYERKAIHEALSSFPKVRTYSRGQGSNRHVIIEPLSGGKPQRS